MTLAHADQCSETTARALTDQLRQSIRTTNELAAKLPRSRRTSSWVYFIQTGIYADDPVKIGVANNVRARLAQLQTGSPYELRLLGVVAGGEAEERELHRRFAHLHLRGEWFEGADELRSAIAGMSR